MKKGVIFVLIFGLLASVLMQGYQKYADTTVLDITREKKEVAINDFLRLYTKKAFSKIDLVDDTSLKGYMFVSSGTKTPFSSLQKPVQQTTFDVFETKKPLTSSLTDLGISMTGAVKVNVLFTTPSFWNSLFSDFGPILLFLILLFVLFKFIMPKGGSFPFATKVGKLNNKALNKTKFSDIAGMDEVKSELSEIVDYLKHPGKYQKVGARHPKGVLLYGEPGSGKTLLARAVAGESNVAFFSVSGSEFMEMLVGMGAAKVRELFGKAKAAGKAIIFIDEIDAIGKRRGSGFTGGHQEQEQTLNQILTEMDGFDGNTNIIVMAATNRPDVLDPALLRAGRFDRKIIVSRPTYEERILIFEYYLKAKKIAKDVEISSLAKRTIGLVGADIENIVNEASLKLAKDSRTVLEKADFEYALEKTLMGPEKKGKAMNDKEKRIVAYHELGHAITSYLLPNADPVEKVSIVRRGQALGVTWLMPDEDVYLNSKAKFLDDVVSLLAGRAAEEVFFGEEEITTGASNDFERATRIITDLVVKYGMDKDIGPVCYQDTTEQEYRFAKAYSEKTAEQIDQKIKEYLSSSYAKAKQMILERKPLFDRMALELLDKEFLSKEEFLDLVRA